MPARVHALLVVRPDGRTPADLHLERTLAALQAQTRPVDALTIALCGTDERLREVVTASAAEGVIAMPRGAGYADAVRAATHRLDGDAVWLLAQDTCPEPDALAGLVATLETAPSVAIAAPKLVRWNDPGRLVSLGVSVTRFGRTVRLGDGELDQGQHDATPDVLGADVRGLLVRADAWRALDGLDPALTGADEGLDLSIRARLAGFRIALSPSARVGVAGDGVAGVPASNDPIPRMRRWFAVRSAQLHRRLVYAPAAVVLLHWLSFLPLAAWRTLRDLLTKQPGRIGPEWAAAVVAMCRVPAVLRARGRIRRTRRTSWARLAGLRVSRAQLRQHLDAEDGGDDAHADDLGFFSGGGAWVVLAALVASVAAFPALLAWPVLGGGALAPLRATVGRLWADAAYGLRPLGWEVAGPADPFSAVIAVIGSLWPGEPSRALVILWVLALPLAALGAWFAATRVTAKPVLRATAAVAWTLAPAFLAALVDGRPTGVLVHLLLPWLLFTGAVARRSWSSAGVASLLAAAVLACAPSLAPALVGLWAGAIVLVIVFRRGQGVAHIVWLLVPALVIAAPLVWRQLRSGNPWSLLADPGVTWAGPQVAADVGGRALLAAGFPTPDPGGWGRFLGDAGATWWVPLLVAPVVLLALLAPFTVRRLAAVCLLAMAAAGLSTAFVVVGISVAADAGQPVALWPGPALSLAYAGMIGAAAVTLDLLSPVPAMRTAAASVVMLALAASAVPALTASSRGAAELTGGAVSTLPAYVAAEGRDSPGQGTIVITPLSGGDLETSVVWGDSATLGGQTTLLAARSEPTSSDLATAEVTAALVTGSSGDVVARLAEHGIGFVLLAQAPGGETDAARAVRLGAVTAIDQRDGLDGVGETDRGTLWRVSVPVAARAALEPDARVVARSAALLQLGVVGVALLLALPTRASRAVARRTTRIVGAHPEELR
ncbi:glycosyltransferase [Microbacterium sp.]|uniref:glycosyltransferase n=1 Tax=Microbacterium sp. TaxID=51671 RepID=UPI0039E4E73D